jgi:hypothetical protein
MVDYLGLYVLLALSLNMWALLSVWPSGASILAKTGWSIVLLTLPGLAFLAWYLIGPRVA